MRVQVEDSHFEMVYRNGRYGVLKRRETPKGNSGPYRDWAQQRKCDGPILFYCPVLSLALFCLALCFVMCLVGLACFCLHCKLTARGQGGQGGGEGGTHSFTQDGPQVRTAYRGIWEDVGGPLQQ